MAGSGKVANAELYVCQQRAATGVFKKPQPSNPENASSAETNLPSFGGAVYNPTKFFTNVE